MILDDNSLAQKLATDARVAFLSFIGSAKVGWYLRTQLAPGTRCALEHGGAAPVIVEEGATVAAGGHPIGDRLYEPTILVEPRPSSRVSTNEIFGPVTCVYGFSTLSEAIALLAPLVATARLKKGSLRNPCACKTAEPND